MMDVVIRYDESTGEVRSITRLSDRLGPEQVGSADGVGVVDINEGDLPAVARDERYVVDTDTGEVVTEPDPAKQVSLLDRLLPWRRTP